MVRLDRAIGFLRLILTGLFRLMVRSSRTMTKEERPTRGRPVDFAPVGPGPRIA
jgi:hypothetical protein